MSDLKERVERLKALTEIGDELASVRRELDALMPAVATLEADRERLRVRQERALAIIGIYDMSQGDPDGVTAEGTVEAIRAALAGEDTQ